MRLIAALLLAMTTASAGEVYRWVDDKGVVHYSDGPPNPSAKPVELPKLQTYQPTAPAASTRPEPEAKKVDVAPISITQPQAGETIRDPDGRVSVSVSSAPGIGQGYVYLVDGRPVSGAPSPSSTYLLEGLERGEHTIAASLVSSDGQEIARTAPVTIYLMPPTVKAGARKKG